MDADSIAREIVKYAFEHDVLTQHGMTGIRKKIVGLVTPADELHRLALVRIDKLMGAREGSRNGDELNLLVEAVHAYEAVRCDFR